MKLGKEEKDLTLMDQLGLSEEMETKLLVSEIILQPEHSTTPRLLIVHLFQELQHEESVKQLERLRDQMMKKLLAQNKNAESKRS